MSAEPARSHLRLIRVDDDTGEARPVESQALEELEAELVKLRGDRKNLERDLRMYRRRAAELERDRIRERLEHPDREFIKRVCVYWHRRCRTKDYDGPRRIDPLAPNRFDAVAALAEMERIETYEDRNGRTRRRRTWRYTAEVFKAAIDGGEFDPFETTHRNGKVERHNDLAQLCKDTTRFERAAEKAPYASGTFRDGDFFVPAVPGFERLSAAELKRLARAREEAHTSG